jgi:hypothetical protein
MAGEAQEIPLLVSTTQIGDFTEVSHLVQQALSFSETTPHAFRCQLCDVTQQTPLFFDFLHTHLKTALCLSVGIQDVVVVKRTSNVRSPPLPVLLLASFSRTFPIEPNFLCRDHSTRSN